MIPRKLILDQADCDMLYNILSDYAKTYDINLHWAIDSTTLKIDFHTSILNFTSIERLYKISQSLSIEEQGEDFKITFVTGYTPEAMHAVLMVIDPLSFNTKIEDDIILEKIFDLCENYGILINDLISKYYSICHLKKCYNFKQLSSNDLVLCNHLYDLYTQIDNIIKSKQ